MTQSIVRSHFMITITHATSTMPQTIKEVQQIRKGLVYQQPRLGDRCSSGALPPRDRLASLRVIQGQCRSPFAPPAAAKLDVLNAAALEAAIRAGRMTITQIKQDQSDSHIIEHA
jgi:hypothetical protein